MTTGLNTIEALLKQVEEGHFKSAGEIPPQFKKKDEKEEKEKDEKSEKSEDKDDDKKSDKDDDETKEARELFARLNLLPAEIRKTAAEQANALFLMDLQQQKAAAVEIDEVGLFNAVFEDRTEKLASADPWYGQFLHQQQVKLAFNQAFESTVAEVKQAALAQQFGLR